MVFGTRIAIVLVRRTMTTVRQVVVPIIIEVTIATLAIIAIAAVIIVTLTIMIAISA